MFNVKYSRKHNVILILTDDQDIELGSMNFMPKTMSIMKERGTEFKSGSYIPPGWDEWHAIVKNSKFYNYTMNSNGEREKFGFEYEKDYFTDLITNRSLKFIEKHIKTGAWQPFALIISYPAPHGPEDPAPQFAHLFENEISHRTGSWNFAPNPDKQWLLQRTGKMNNVHVAFTDLLHRRRLQTLQSVDDGVSRLFNLLRELNQLWNTYALYTSDHGYHLGQFGLLKGKNMPYEFDIRVPFFMRGPGIPRNASFDEIVTNVDIAPTLLHIAGIQKPARMNGRSLLELFALKKKKRKHSSPLKPWRDTILIERGKMPKLKKIRDRWMKQKKKFNKENRLSKECKRRKWQRDCVHGQLWKCYYTVEERWRIYKCRDNWNDQCPCRKKRELFKDYKDETDEFLRHADRALFASKNQWFQGEIDEKGEVEEGGWFTGWFGNDEEEEEEKEHEEDERASFLRSARVKRGILNKCECSKNVSHPIKLLELKMSKKRQYLKYKKKAQIGYLKPKDCSLPQMNCFTHTASHWKTPPLWPSELGEFCFCQNCNNNTYWCLRTKNETHNFLYCEFVTEFISFYDFNTDPDQLINAVYSLDIGVLEQLSEQLRNLRKCKNRQCELWSTSRAFSSPKLVDLRINNQSFLDNNDLINK
uniref:Sulfatase domain-containing protein n=1 Tax=Caenorhabditis japonica TaxID=281687 RepID=A0A8R1DJE8_CAEJA